MNYLYHSLVLVCTLPIITQIKARECTSDVIQPVSRIRYESISSSTSYACGFLWLSRCRRTRYRMISIQVYQLQTVGTQTDCCEGYARASNEQACLPVCSEGCVDPRICREPGNCVCIDSGYSGDSCNTPVCSDCATPRVCVAPETCQCVGGYTGENCDEDVNECDTENGNCEHICQNTRGSFVCSCRDGFALGTDHARCVGSVNVSLTSLNSSALTATWNYPMWDTEGLTTAYDIVCTSQLSSVSAMVQNGSLEHTIGLDTEQGYECCITVRTLNGNGPSSCTSVAEVTITQQLTDAPTTASTEEPPHSDGDHSSQPTDSDIQNTPITESTDQQTSTGGGSSSSGSQSDAASGKILHSSAFKIGIGTSMGVALVAVLAVLALLVVCCVLRKGQHKKAPISEPQRYRVSSNAHYVDNELYGEEMKEKPQDLDAESIEKSDLEYNEVYHGARENDYAEVREFTYHYVKH